MSESNGAAFTGTVELGESVLTQTEAVIAENTALRQANASLTAQVEELTKRNREHHARAHELNVRNTELVGALNRKSLVVRFKKLDPRAIMPRYQSDGAAGLDLHAIEDGELHEGKSMLVPTGIGIELPEGWEATVRPRSGLAGKGIVPAFGTIDSDYRGPIGVRLFNFWSADGKHDVYFPPFSWKAGDRIGQLVISPVARATLVEADELSETARGGAGFGSTGK